MTGRFDPPSPRSPMRTIFAPPLSNFGSIKCVFGKEERNSALQSATGRLPPNRHDQKTRQLAGTRAVERGDFSRLNRNPGGGSSGARAVVPLPNERRSASSSSV